MGDQPSRRQPQRKGRCRHSGKERPGVAYALDISLNNRTARVEAATVQSLFNRANAPSENAASAPGIAQASIQ